MGKMKRKRLGCSAVAIGKKLFVIGGMNENNSLSSCEMHDLSDQSRESHILPPMSHAKTGSGAVVYDNNKVVVMGGCDDVQDSATVELLDTINNKWVALPSMPTPRSFFAVGVSGTNIIA